MSNNKRWEKPSKYIYPLFDTELLQETAEMRWDRVTLKMVGKYYPGPFQLEFVFVFGLFATFEERRELNVLCIFFFDFLCARSLVCIEFSVYYFYYVNYEEHLNWSRATFGFLYKSTEIYSFLLGLCRLKLALINCGSEVVLYTTKNKPEFYFYSNKQLKTFLKLKSLTTIIKQINNVFIYNFNCEIVYKRYKNKRGYIFNKNCWDPLFKSLLRIIFFCDKYGK